MDTLESSIQIQSKRNTCVFCRTFVTFGDDLTPAWLIILLADVLIKQTIWKRTDKETSLHFNLLMHASWRETIQVYIGF